MNSWEWTLCRPIQFEQALRLNQSITSAKMAGVKLLYIKIAFVCMCMFNVSYAAPEDRGPRGSYVAVATGMIMGSATDLTGESAGSHIGSAYSLRFGEEVLPRLTIGMNISGGQATANQDLYETYFAGLLFDATWQPKASVPISILLGTGFGGGELTPRGTPGFSGQVAGAIHVLGIHYDLRWTRAHGGGWCVSPYLRGHLLPASGDSQTHIITWAVGVETAWSWGR
jgi:hypothetical protein